jgi:cell division protein FtsB
MTVRRTFTRAGQAVLGPFLAIVLILYFAFNLVQGDHGLIAWSQKQQQVQAAQASLAQTEDELRGLRHRADLLKGDHLDPDLLDERARAALNEVGPNEVVIFTPETPVGTPRRH